MQLSVKPRKRLKYLDVTMKFPNDNNQQIIYCIDISFDGMYEKNCHVCVVKDCWKMFYSETNINEILVTSTHIYDRQDQGYVQFTFGLPQLEYDSIIGLKSCFQELYINYTHSNCNMVPIFAMSS